MDTAARVYPAPEGVPASDRYEVRVDGRAEDPARYILPETLRY